MLLSLPDTWNYSVRGLSSITPDGVDGVLTALKELERLGYGSYGNVLLSDTEYGKLRQEFPGDYQMRVERLSEYMASTGRNYKNHLATIRSWAKREKPKYNPADYTFEEGDSL